MEHRSEALHGPERKKKPVHDSYEQELERKVRELHESRLALKESHDRYAQLYDFAPVGYLTLNELGIVKEINLTAAALLGVDRHWLMERSLGQWIQPKETLLFRRHMKQARDSRSKVSTMFQIVRQDRSVVPVELSTVCTRDSSGVTQCRSALIDLTEQRRSEQQLAAAISVAKIGFLESDLVNKILTTSAQFQEDWGVRPGDSVAELITRIHPDDLDRVNKIREKACEARRPFRAEFRVVRPDGQISWIEAQGSITFDSDGKPIHYFGTSVNVTERKMYELKFGFERYKLNVIFRESPAAMAIFRGPELVIEMVNTEYQKFFDRRELLGLPLLEALPELKSQPTESQLKKVFRTGESFTAIEVRMDLARVAGGPLEQRYFDLSYVRFLDWENKPYGIYCHAADVTARVMNQKALEASRAEVLEKVKELEAERELRDRFVAALTHDLRTPLSVAQMSAELLLRQEPTPQQVKVLAERISRNATRADQMIRDLLDAGRIKAGEPITLEIAECELTSLVNKVLENLRLLHGDRFVVDGKGPINGTWDRKALVRMLENLTGNAVKYGKKGGPITIGLRQDGEFVEISVHNEGHPISRKDQAKLFESYHRTAEAMMGGQKGWGLGLTLVKGFAEAHGGTVSVRSARGEGTTFTLRLPLKAS